MLLGAVPGAAFRTHVVIAWLSNNPRLLQGLCVAHSVHNGLTKAPGTHAMLHGEKVGLMG